MIQQGGVDNMTQNSIAGAYSGAADPCGKIRIATYKRNGECSIVEIDGDLSNPQDVRKALDRMDEEYLKQEQLREKSRGSKTLSKIGLGVIMTGIGVTPGLSAGNPALAAIGGAVGLGIYFYGMIKGGHFR